MPLATFHPVVQSWFKQRFGEPSPPQAAGWPAIAQGLDTLICAPTGSGKTLAAFMACLDALFRQALDGALNEETQVVYISPLKALSNDIQKNLREPLEGIRDALCGTGSNIAAGGAPLLLPEIRVLVRTGDTLAPERQAMIRRPPHILVTTPESLFILLTSQKSRERLRSVRTVIVDEIHAVAKDKRGAHLALSLERLDALCPKPPQRIGLSATQRPVERVAQFLTGVREGPRATGSDVAASAREQRTGSNIAASGTPTAPPPRCQVIDLGHLRRVELSVEVPDMPLEAVCSYETWAKVYDRLTVLIKAHRTTLIFVNTRSLCERLARQLTERLGEDKAAAHHGSLSRSQRLSAEERLKSGELSALVATSSLELGIDIGAVDLVCQLGVTQSIGALLQRVGRAGHSLGGISRGKIFPLTIDELGTAAALAGGIKRGDLDLLHIPSQPRDILAQHIVAAAAAEDWDEDALFALVRRAYNYRELERTEFDEIVRMLADGFTTRRGRRGALLHYDGVGHRIRGRRGARLAAITSGGAIPDAADYQVVQDPQGLVVGTLDEHFAVESSPGDIFQLGNTTWRILKVEIGKVRVEDARGQPPNVPFWFGEAPARSDELSAALSLLRKEIEARLEGGTTSAECRVLSAEGAVRDSALSTQHSALSSGLESAIQYVMESCNFPRSAAEQLCVYYADSKKVLSVLPTTETLVLERFFDESGGMQLVLHAPFGRRINWAWGLALRKRFCRAFNFELQAAASDSAVLLSLGAQHSFPLADVFNYLKANAVEPLLIQAALVSPIFQTRWRWDACRSLALLRFSGGKKVPPHLLRMRSDDLLAAIFPHAAACPENLPGDREVPDHPLVREVIGDCLHEAMDVDGLKRVLSQIESGALRLVAKDTVEPSRLAGEILAARPYAFLDDADINERRTRAVITRRSLSREDAQSVGALDANAIQRVRDECRPDPRDADELHDALMTSYFLSEEEGRAFDEMFQALAETGRATRVLLPSPLVGEGPGMRAETLRIAAATERVPLFEAVFGKVVCDPPVEVPTADREKVWTREDALAEIVRGRMEALGPVTVAELAGSMGVARAALLSAASATPVENSDIDAALLALEAQGTVLRGQFSPGRQELEWCDRRLLARIHRYTLERLRREIEPVSASDYMRFLFSWQHLDPDAALEGPRGVVEVIGQLQGFEIAALAWERDILPGRVRGYERKWLDQFSLSGEICWGRRFPPQPDAEGGRHSGQIRHAPIGLFMREQLDFWLALARELPADESHLSGAARETLALLRKRGAVFFQSLVKETKRLPAEIELALGELLAMGLATGDGFAGLRALLVSASKRAKVQRRRRRLFLRHQRALRRFPILGMRATGSDVAASGPDESKMELRLPPSEGSLRTAGRWSLFRGDGAPDLFGKVGGDEVAERVARQLLRRWGVVFHRALLRETGLPPWLELLRVFRRMEARGELRGGRFVAGFSGEQYALPEAVEQLRAVRKRELDGRLITICGADPLNLAGIVTPGEKIAARALSRVVYRDGVPVAVKEAGETRILQHDVPPALKSQIDAALVRKAI